MPNLTIDGKPITVPDGTLLITAIKEAKSKVPHYCYHAGLSIAGNCRICQVEIEGMPKSVIACNTRVAEGMVVSTCSKKAKESQQTVLEFLLANHPLDCPVCDQAGECKLQDYYMEYGLYDSKFNEVKVKKTKKAFAIGPTIMLDQERCILCTRCVRFTDEITKTHDFGIFNRGDHAEINVYPGKELNNKYSGNVADICPVGALTDRDFRFKMRVWYLGSTPSVCPGCSRGCNINIEYEKSRPYKTAERVMRLKPRENKDVNKWWICDEGRYGYKFIDHDRLTEPRLRGAQTSWDAALEAAARAIKIGRWALLTSGQYTNEDYQAMKKLFKDHLKWERVGFKTPADDGFEDEFLIKKDKNPNTAGASVAFGAHAELAPVAKLAAEGGCDGLMIFGRDVSKACGLETWNKIRAAVKTVITEGSNDNICARTADIVLPSAVYAEKDGTFTNFEGRVQRIQRALKPLGGSRPTVEILAGLAKALGIK